MNQAQNLHEMKVVVVDDDPIVLNSINLALSTIGFDTKAFNDPVEAIEWIRNNGTDIVISDICMPECDGFSLLQQIKDIDPSIDVIFITAHGQVDTAIKALRNGASDFFEKPFTTADLCASMERTRKYHDLCRQKSILQQQVTALSEEVAHSANHSMMVGQSKPMKVLAQDIIDIAATKATVLILGESGTGKELVASAIHSASDRSNKPFLTLNCPSIPEDLFESEMFGHKKGAFTGAIDTRIGYVEAADGGTLFLDEIADLPTRSQAKILRLLEQKTYTRVGESTEKSADVRIIAATNCSLTKLVQEDKFREDLYYRLNVCSIDVPPLRDRKVDIPLLAVYFALQFADEIGKPIDGVDNDALTHLSTYNFPGNVRELRNIIESSIIRTKRKGNLTRNDLPLLQNTPSSSDVKDNSFSNQVTSSPSAPQTFAELEKQLYTETLTRTGNNVSEAARLLGLSRGKLRRRLADLDLA